MTTAVPRISPQEARERMKRSGALLVCAYDDPAKYEHCQLDGSMGLNEFRARVDQLPKDRDVIFY